MKVFYVFDKKYLGGDYPAGHIAKPLAEFLNCAMNFRVLARDYELHKVALAEAKSMGGLQMAIQNEYFFVLRLTAAQEAKFIELFNAYQLINNNEQFIDHVLSSAHPIGAALRCYESAEAERLQMKLGNSHLRFKTREKMQNFLGDAPKAILGEIKHHMQIVPNRCRVRLRTCPFTY